MLAEGTRAPDFTLPDQRGNPVSLSDFPVVLLVGHDGESLRAVAEPLHIGRTSQVWSIEIRDEASRLICVSRCTLAVVPAPEGFKPLPPSGE